MLRKKGKIVEVPLFEDDGATCPGRKYTVTFRFCKVQDTPYVSLASFAYPIKLKEDELAQQLQDLNIPYSQVYISHRAERYIAFDFFIHALDVLPATGCNAPALDRIYTQAKSPSFRRRVFKRLALPLDAQCALKLKTTAGDYVCCGTASFKPIAKARFE